MAQTVRQWGCIDPTSAASPVAVDATLLRFGVFRMSAPVIAPPPARDPGRFGGLRDGFRSLRHRNYRLFWLGQLVSVSGTWMSMLALSYLVAYELDASPFQLSLVGAFQFGPILFLGLVGGVVADRFP